MNGGLCFWMNLKIRFRFEFRIEAMSSALSVPDEKVNSLIEYR